MADNNLGANQEPQPIKNPNVRQAPSPTDRPDQAVGRKAVDVNQLSQMRSYSYYFSLVLCRNAEIAETLSTSTDLSVWEHPQGPDQARDYLALGKYAPRALDGGNSSNDYVVLIFGATDADFSITDVKWMSITAAEAVPNDIGNSIAIEGSIKVSEPRGIIFVDTIVLATQALGVDPSSVVWMLKPFFVGYANAGSLQNNVDIPQHISTIKPTMFIPLDVAGVFTESGGMYEIPFVGLANGASRLPQYSRAADGFTVNVGPALKDAMQQLVTQINSRYQDYYKCVTAKIAAVDQQQVIDGTPPVNRTGPQNYLPIEYIILLDPVYCADRYLVSDTPQQYQDKPGDCKTGGGKFKQTIGGSIESAIRSIMLMSPQVRDDMTGIRDDRGVEIKYEFKIHSSLRSLDDRMQIIYTVKQFVSPKGGLIEQLIGGTSESQRVMDKETINRHLVVFDYVYTGLNTDILEFDIKLNMGMAYIQTAASANSFKNQAEVTASRNTHINPFVDTLDRNSGKKPIKIPIFFGGQAQAIGNNTNSSGSSIGSAYTMAKHANLEVAEATVKIRGNTAYLEAAAEMSNPSIVQQFLDAKVPPLQSGQPINVCSAVPTASAQQQTANTGMKMGSFPLLAKINIKMPTNNDDLQAFRDRTSYASNFWFQGYYYVYGIEHEFQEGDFVQTLLMIALPDPQDFEFLKRQKARSFNFTQETQDCFDSIVPNKEQKTRTDGTPEKTTAADMVARGKGDTSQKQTQENCVDTPATPPVVQQPPRYPAVPPTPTSIPIDRPVPVAITCDDINSHVGPFPSTFRLSPNYLLKDLTKNVRVSPGYDLQAHAGLTEKEIVCNLRALCYNIIEPLRARYGDSIAINSAFRIGDLQSQHGKGEAVDIAFPALERNSKSMVIRAQQVVNQVPFDQFILEANNTAWLHISFTRGASEITEINKVLTKPSATTAFTVGLVEPF